MSVTWYDVVATCNKCGGDNEGMEYDMDQPCHWVKTKCNDCGFLDYWDTGFFESGASIKSKSRQYRYIDGVYTTRAREES